MNSPTLFLFVLAATLIVGVLLGRRYEACSQRIDGMLADGERAAAISDAAASAETASDWGWSL